MPPPVIAVPAAAILLVRDGDALDVLMGRRHQQLRFGPGAHVFPGGRLDAQDGDPAWADDADGGEHLDIEDRSHRICAIREVFEETGILLTHHAASDFAARAASLRQPVISGEVSFRQALGQLGVRLDLNALVRFARWITPEQQPVRFDCIFYIARAPENQTALCDGYELISADWLQPAQALQLADAGAMRLMRPTRANLELLAATEPVEAGSVEAALAAAKARPPTTILQRD